MDPVLFAIEKHSLKLFNYYCDSSSIPPAVLFALAIQLKSYMIAKSLLAKLDITDEIVEETIGTPLYADIVSHVKTKQGKVKLLKAAIVRDDPDAVRSLLAELQAGKEPLVEADLEDCIKDVPESKKKFLNGVQQIKRECARLCIEREKLAQSAQ